MILAGDEAQVQFATGGVRSHLSGPRGSLASLEGRFAFRHRTLWAQFPTPGGRRWPARLSLRHPAGSQAGCAGGRDRYAPRLRRSHDAGARLSYADPYKMHG